MIKILLLFSMVQDTLYLSESDAYQMAITNSPFVQSSKRGVLSAYYNKKSQFSSFLPQVSLTGAYTRISLQQKMRSFVLDSLVMTPSGAFVPVGHYVEIPFSQRDNYNLGFTIQQPLFTFGKLFFNYKSAIWKLKSERLKDSITRGYMGIVSREIYTQAQIAKAYYELMRRIYREFKEVYEITAEKYKNGTATEIEYLEANLAYKTQKSRILLAKNSMKKALNMLKVILGIGPEITVILTDSIKPLVLDLDTLKPEFLDLKHIDYTIKSLDYQRKVLDRLTMPTVFSAFSYKYQKPFGMENQWKGYWVFTLGVEWNIFDGLKSINQSKSFENTIKQLKIIRNMKEKQRLLEIRLKMEELESAKEAYEIEKENVNLATTLYHASKKQYEEGYITYSDFSHIVMNYHSSLVNKLSALAGLKLKQLEYLKYIKGYILESDEAQRNQWQNFSSSTSDQKYNKDNKREGGF